MHTINEILHAIIIGSYEKNREKRFSSGLFKK